MTIKRVSEVGYRDCACRDCFEIAIGREGALCSDCESAGCEADGGECCCEFSEHDSEVSL